MDEEFTQVKNMITRLRILSWKKVRDQSCGTHQFILFIYVYLFLNSISISF